MSQAPPGMRAIVVQRFGDPDVLELRETPMPSPGPDDVLVHVHAAGVNPYDAYMRAGAYGAKNPTLPYTPGSDAAGTVVWAGAGARSWAPGMRVYTTGTQTGAYAEFTVCRPDQLQVLPDSVGFAQGAGLYVPYATAYRALFQMARARPGETVLVHGASGGVGLAAIHWARAAGLTVLGTAGSKPGLRLITEQGADGAFDHHGPDYRAAILEATGGRGTDVILEMLANVNLGHDLRMLAHGGRVAVIGSRGDVQITPRDLMSREASVMGVLLWHMPPRDAAEVHAAMAAGLRQGTLSPVVGATFPLAEAAAAHRHIMEAGALGKIVLLV